MASSPMSCESRVATPENLNARICLLFATVRRTYFLELCSSFPQQNGRPYIRPFTIEKGLSLKRMAQLWAGSSNSCAFTQQKNGDAHTNNIRNERQVPASPSFWRSPKDVLSGTLFQLPPTERPAIWMTFHNGERAFTQTSGATGAHQDSTWLCKWHAAQGPFLFF